jgi:hypothetical protein
LSKKSKINDTNNGGKLKDLKNENINENGDLNAQ